jgi:small subunit ribosomal protein S16
MVKLRLARAGAKKKPYYRIVAADERYPRDGRFLEQVGTYNPLQKPASVVIYGESLDRWVKNGAVLTDTVRELLKVHAEAGTILKSAVPQKSADELKASVERARASRKARTEKKRAARKAAAA